MAGGAGAAGPAVRGGAQPGGAAVGAPGRPAGGASELLTEREPLKAKVSFGGVQMLDVLPDELSLAAVNRYLDIKARGVL